MAKLCSSEDIICMELHMWTHEFITRGFMNLPSCWSTNAEVGWLHGCMRDSDCHANVVSGG